MREPPTLRLSSEEYEFWIVDYVMREVVIVKQNGERHSQPLSADDVPDDSQIAASVFHWEKWWVSIITKRHDVVFLMGFNPESDDPSPKLPTVYLDQNMWSQVATAQVAPERIQDSKERDAALEIVRLASDAGIILPLSSAHLLETSALHTERRYEVGLAIAHLSGGWQMRHPMDVFQHESACALSDHLGLGFDTTSTPRSIVTTEPNAWQAKDAFGLGDPLPADLDTLQKMLIAPAALVSVLVDPEAYRRVPVTNWIAHHQQITMQMANVAGKEQRRRTARRRFWNENIGFYRRALLDISGSDDLPTFSDKDLRGFLERTPMISLLSELFIQRFIDSKATWRHNDLIDMLYLACAAGHCDYVVAEARTGTQLRQIQRSQQRPQTAFTKLSALVTALHAAGVATDSERTSRVTLEDGGDNGSSEHPSTPT